jgi:hypothetical protein
MQKVPREVAGKSLRNDWCVFCCSGFKNDDRGKWTGQSGEQRKM